MKKSIRKIRITAVSYLNTKPLLYGLLNSPVADQIDLQLNIPSVCAHKLQTDEADLGLVPVAIIPELSTPRIVSDYCIGTVGAVKTVALFAERPLPQLDRILLDYHSRTSVALTRILLTDYWQIDPLLVPAQTGFIDEIGGSTGGLVIGDRTIGLERRFTYVYDLGKAWMDHTGLPFVFAAWVSNRVLPKSFITAFNAALKSGVDKVPELMYLLPAPDPEFDLEEYYTRYISYPLDQPKRLALARFLDRLSGSIPTTIRQSLALAETGISDH